MQETIVTNPSGILVLVAENRDYDFPITNMIKKGWNVEIWFWKSGMKIEYFMPYQMISARQISVN
ncbi:hypothetical protein C1645_834707 [Glomus cerebriforme]|uniref:Uncharacterized protein n=1 Tax=Glomus cerebriforme TaxID=658196 RepID=A0A397S947_9GLOM|nr:hypothetical protein C1645_834707 [Glomus cerebriforme]